MTLNVVCIGSGYVGSVTGAAWAALGHRTTLVDLDERRVQRLREGISPIYEPGLEQVIEETIGETLFADTSYETVHDADVVVLCVGTPPATDGTADLRAVKAAAESVGSHLNPSRRTVVVVKSTVPPGTSEALSEWVANASGLKAERDFGVVSNPEFLRQGFALEDVLFPDRIVVGCEQEHAMNVLQTLYEGILRRDGYEQLCERLGLAHRLQDPLPAYYETDTKSAEMIKYASNAFLAVKISYINEVARLCERTGANALQVAEGMGLDSRIGNRFLQVSSGWSGSCFTKDTAEFYATSVAAGAELGLVKAAIDSNLEMHEHCVQKILRRLGTLQGKTIGVLGLTFKPNTDDARFTQASPILSRLLELGAHVQVHDPQGMEQFRFYNPKLPVVYTENPEQVAEGADALVLLTHWDDYQALDWQDVAKRMKGRYLLDTRNVLSWETLQASGLDGEGLGLSAQRAKRRMSVRLW